MATIAAQYKAIKAKYPDGILLFRVGNFYEVFDDDARGAKDVLGGLFMEQPTGEQTAAVLSIPHYSLDVALQKLVKAGYKVGICDQLEDPKTAIGPLKRGVTDLIQ